MYMKKKRCKILVFPIQEEKKIVNVNHKPKIKQNKHERISFNFIQPEPSKKIYNKLLVIQKKSAFWCINIIINNDSLSNSFCTFLLICEASKKKGEQMQSCISQLSLVFLYSEKRNPKDNMI